MISRRVFCTGKLIWAYGFFSVVERYLVYTGDLFNWKWRSTTISSKQRQELAKQQRLQHFNFRFSWQCHIHASWYYSMSSTDKYIRDMTNEIIGTWLWLRWCDEIRWYRMLGPNNTHKINCRTKSTEER